jgi:hypothetical protein
MLYEPGQCPSTRLLGSLDAHAGNWRSGSAQPSGRHWRSTQRRSNMAAVVPGVAAVRRHGVSSCEPCPCHNRTWLRRENGWDNANKKGDGQSEVVEFAVSLSSNASREGSDRPGGSNDCPRTQDVSRCTTILHAFRYCLSRTLYGT